MPPKRADADEICPVCKSSRYLNPKMKFLIEPSCYHKMCGSCVDRIFSQGPAPCPVAGCGRTLRKNKFRPPKFEDLKIEREVDIRARVAKTLNRREADFVTLRDFNDYEEKKEEIIWNLVKGVDVAETEAMLRSYATENKASIEQNARIERSEREGVEEAERQRVERSAMAREEAIREQEEERAERKEGRKKIIEGLASGLGDANRIVREGERQLKQSSLKRAALERDREEKIRAETEKLTLGNGVASSAATALGFKGLRQAPARVEEGPYDPFGGLVFQPKYYTLQSDYEYSWLDDAKTNPAITAGGYDVKEYFARAQIDAHAGLGIFFGAEKVK